MKLLNDTVRLGLLAALTWGGGDFSGGMAVKRGGGSLRTALRVVLAVHLASFAVLLLLVHLHHDPPPTGAPLLWSLLAGASAGTCVIAFYVCLARGAMGAAAAVSGLLAAAIPAVVSGVLEGSPGAPALLGFVLAAAAIWLIAQSSAHDPTPSATTVLAIISGVGFGIYFVALRQASPAGLLWPLALSRSMSVLLCIVGLLWMAAARRPEAAAGSPPLTWLTRSSLGWAVSTAVLDTSGNLFYLAAVRSGRLDIAAVLASLYPASTILLAAWLLRERPTRQQALGMALAAVAVLLITR